MLKMGRLSNFGEEREQDEIVIRPVTENPKVRELVIQASFKFGGSPEKKEALLTLMDKLKKWDSKSLIRYFLYEFAEEKSKELGKFYNPESGEQQQEFLHLAVNSIDEKVKAFGMEIYYAKFSLA
jgi:ribosomal protein S24E